MQDDGSLLYLILGCWGRNDDGFVSCPSVSNPILHIHKNLEDYNDISRFLKSVGLADKRVMDYNAARNVIFALQRDYRMKGPQTFWTERQFRIIENFTIVHKPCGIYLALDFILPAQVPKPKEERSVLIKPTKF